MGFIWIIFTEYISVTSLPTHFILMKIKYLFKNKKQKPWISYIIKHVFVLIKIKFIKLFLILILVYFYCYYYIYLFIYQKQSDTIKCIFK